MSPSAVSPLPAAVSIPPVTFPTPPLKPTSPAVAEAAASAWLSAFNKHLPSASPELQSLFHASGSWRDHLCLSWGPHTLHGPEKIHDFLSSHPQGVRIKRVSHDTTHPIRIVPLDHLGKCPAVNVWLNVETDVGSGRGLLKLVDEGGEWKAFTLYTTLTELRGFEERIESRRPTGVEHGADKDRKSWKERRAEEREFLKSEPAVLIIGGGQGGLVTAARLKVLGVEALIVDKNERVGDNWRKRYNQLVLHDPVYYDHLPYLPFPSSWPIFTPKDKLADWFESYASALELNFWTSTTPTSVAWDDATSTWTVTLQRGDKNETRVVKPRHIVLATGHSGEPLMPTFEGMDTFKGLLCHSSQWPGAGPAKAQDGRRKKAVVVGCCNSGHDIAQDYFERGWEVTLVQRSSTLVISSENGLGTMLKGLYDENGPGVEDADMEFMGMPMQVLKANHKQAIETINRLDKVRLDGLKGAGFKLDVGPHDCGFFAKYLERGGGYYIDVGCSALIASGDVKVKQGVEVASISAHHIHFADGTSLEADEIICATGYDNMRTTAGKILGEENVAGMHSAWGTDAEGELRGVWRRGGVKGLWAAGGNLALTRYWSRQLALQIRAVEAGLMKWEDW